MNTAIRLQIHTD